MKNPNPIFFYLYFFNDFMFLIKRALKKHCISLSRYCASLYNNRLISKLLFFIVCFLFTISTYSQSFANENIENESIENRKLSDSVVQHLVRAIQIKTISNQDNSVVNNIPFLGFPSVRVFHYMLHI